MLAVSFSIHLKLALGGFEEVQLMVWHETMWKNLPETGDKSEIEVEDVLQPLNGGSGLVGKDLDEVRASLVTG